MVVGLIQVTVEHPGLLTVPQGPVLMGVPNGEIDLAVQADGGPFAVDSDPGVNSGFVFFCPGDVCPEHDTECRRSLHFFRL